MVILNASYIRLGLDRTYLDDLADLEWVMDMAYPYLKAPCYLAFVLLPLPVLGL